MRTLFFLFTTLIFITNARADPAGPLVHNAQDSRDGALLHKVVDMLSVTSYFPKTTEPFRKIKWLNTRIDSKDVAYCRFSDRKESFLIPYTDDGNRLDSAITSYLLNDVFAKRAHSITWNRSRHVSTLKRFLIDNIKSCGSLKNKKAISFLWQLNPFEGVDGAAEEKILSLWLLFFQRVNFVLDKNTRKLLKIN